MTNSDSHRLNWTCRPVNQRGRQRRIYCHTYSTTLKKLDPYRHLSFFNILHTLPTWSCAVHAREASSAPFFFSSGHAQLALLTDFLFHTTPLGSLVAGWRTRANSDTLHVNDDQRSLMCMQQLHLQCNPFFRPLVYLSVLVLHHFFKALYCFVSCFPFFCSLFSVLYLIFRTLFPVFSFSFCFDFDSLFRFHFLFPVFFCWLNSSHKHRNFISFP